VLELPKLGLGSNELGIWLARWTNWEGCPGRPRCKTIASGFPRGEKSGEAYLNGEPANDDRFIACSRTSWNITGGYTPEDAKAVARKLLPDILSYHPNEPARFPQNGRTLTDDVVDLFFSIYANET